MVDPQDSERMLLTDQELNILKRVIVRPLPLPLIEVELVVVLPILTLLELPMSTQTWLPRLIARKWMK